MVVADARYTVGIAPRHRIEASGHTLGRRMAATQRKDHLRMTTLLDLLDAAVDRYGDRAALSLRHDDGTTSEWSFRELQRRPASPRGGCGPWASSPATGC